MNREMGRQKKIAYTVFSLIVALVGSVAGWLVEPFWLALGTAVVLGVVLAFVGVKTIEHWVGDDTR